MRVLVTVFTGLMLLLPISFARPGAAQPQIGGSTVLQPTWTMGIISRGTGDVGILVTDLTNDGVNELVSCSNGSPFVLAKQPGGEYRLAWYGEQLGCRRLASADRDGNGAQELYIASSIPNTKDLQITILDGKAFTTIDEMVIPGARAVGAIAVRDVDDDGAAEIIVVSSSATSIYDAKALTLEWNAVGMGGTDLGIGYIDKDENIELVINGNPAYILDPKAQVAEWAYKGGFGTHMATGDVDQDGMVEIVYSTGDLQLRLLDGDTQTLKWDLPLPAPVVGLAMGDTKKTGVPEIMVSSALGILGYEGLTGENVWAIAHTAGGASMSALVAGDPDGDNLNEIVWGSCHDSTYQGIFVADWTRQKIEWWSGDMGNPLLVQAGALQTAGQTELLVAWPSSDNKGGTDAGLAAYNPATHKLNWSITIPAPYQVAQMGIGQFDWDSGRDIVLVNRDSPRVRVYDGSTHVWQWERLLPSDGAPVKMLVRDIDYDSLDEIILAQTTGVTVIRGPVPQMQVTTLPLTGSVRDIAMGYLDGPGALAIAVLTDQKVSIYNAATWQLRGEFALPNNTHVAIIPATSGMDGQILTYGYTSDRAGNGLHSWNAVTFQPLWSYTPEPWVRISDIQTEDIDGDGAVEVTLLGNGVNDELGPNEPPTPPARWPSVLQIMTVSNPPTWKYRNFGYWGNIHGMVTGDFDQDGIRELFFGADNLVQLSKINPAGAPPTVTPRPSPTPTAVPISFSDVTPNDYFYVPVQYLALHGVISGYADGTYRPYNNTTRGQIAKIVVSGEGWAINTTGGPHFTDVPVGSTFYPYIETALNHGIVSGYSDGTYRPGAIVTRGQVAKIVVAARGWSINTTTGSHFADVGPDNTFYAYIETAYAHGVVGGFGDGTFRPGNPATRGQIAKIVYNALLANTR
jgi:hypothetical protein